MAGFHQPRTTCKFLGAETTESNLDGKGDLRNDSLSDRWQKQGFPCHAKA